VTFTSELVVSVSASEDFFVMDGFDFNTTWRAGVDWVHCDGSSVTAPPGKVGEFCGGYHDRECEDNLNCEYKADSSSIPMEQREGTCADAGK
jgi:hypothetical protein